MPGHLIAPSILAANFKNLESEIEFVNQSEADWLHVDIMDGRFVPNISFGMFIVQAMRDLSEKPLDVHLMIEEPEKYIQRFRDAGADIITVHQEACPHIHRVIQLIKSTGAQAGVAINPGTAAATLEPVLEDVDLICVMAVNPGFGGQKFIYHTIPKLRQLKAMLTERNLSPYIEVDGGVGLHNAESILQAGANVLVAGSSVFKAQNPTDVVSRLKAIGQFLDV